MMDRQSGRRQKVILLSDGNANNGITHTTGLSDIAKGFNPQNIILSTVGMGLDFNENVLASLADNGMGAYSYLEHLAGLETILTAELHDLRSVFAPSSRLQISTSSNTRLVDAGGYPVERSGDYITIPTGQLLYNSTKNLVLSFDVPTHSVGSMELGQLTLKFERDGETTSIQNEQAPIAVAVVEPSLIDDALATINKSVLQDAWQFNNLGMMERAVSQAVRKGDKSQAIQELKRFETQVAQAEETYGIDLNDEKLRSNIYSLRQKVDGAFAGPPAIAAEEQNRVAKEIHQSGRSNQIKLQRR
jgi:Ca-activated chloride channel family protein